MGKILDLIRERATLRRRIREIEQELCDHSAGTYKDVGWSGWSVKCKSCSKVFESGCWDTKA